AVFHAARSDPEGFIEGNPPPLIIDEVQRAPDLLLALKRIVDRHRSPGSYLLTGSANLLTLKTVAETLAGRVVYHELLPFAWSELRQRQSPSTLIDRFFDAEGPREVLAGLQAAQTAEVGRGEWVQAILKGGYPVPALMKDASARSQWFEGYRQTYLERDVRDLANPENLAAFDRLLVVTALRTGQLLNYSELCRDLGIPLSTVRRYFALLEQTYQVWRLQPYFANPARRLVKTPKLYHTDTGLACSLAALDDWEMVERQGRQGPLFETWIASELRKALSLCRRRTQLWFWRTHDGLEVDFVLERGADVVGLEVKWGSEVRSEDLRGLRVFRDSLGSRFRLGIVLHTGSTLAALDARILAVPVGTLLGGRP
ncbi:MAG: ATP-binding protein, partial [Clostridia bacterium]|nr:ATP-binding protein [Clostridia bacterium]